MTDSVTEQERQTRQWAMMLHLSVFAAYIAPLAGIVVPVVIWQIKKDALPAIDAHGRVVVNWILSTLVYVLLGVVLTVVVIGIPLLLALGVATVAFPIIGAIKANDGVLWKYPLSIPFF